jgi:hypothetical protein
MRLAKSDRIWELNPDRTLYNHFEVIFIFSQDENILF